MFTFQAMTYRWTCVTITCVRFGLNGRRGLAAMDHVTKQCACGVGYVMAVMLVTVVPVRTNMSSSVSLLTTNRRHVTPKVF